MEAEMTLMSKLEDLEAIIVKGRVPGTARTLVNLEKITAAINEMKGEMPTQMSEAEGVVRQKDAIIKHPGDRIPGAPGRIPGAPRSHPWREPETLAWI